MKTFCFDTETTGLIDNSAKPLGSQPHIIELYGALVEDDGTILEEVEFLCNPGIEITEEITKITGIKNEDLADKLKFKHYLPQLLSAFKNADAICAHNLAFDLGMLELEFKRLGLPLVCPTEKICTVEATEFIKGRRMGLMELYEHLFGEPFAGAHRAKNDVQALVRCFVELRKKGDL